MATTLQNQLRPATFRGVAFFVDPERGIGLEGGRRNQVHEYPQRDKPYAQDLGRATRMVEFEAFVVGDDYIAQSKALLGALEDYGPGKLVHPWLGTLTVSIQDYRIRYDGGLGRATLQIACVESGELAFPSPSTSTAAVSRAAATNLQAASTSLFAQAVKIVGFVNRVAVAALSTYAKVLRFLGNPVGAVLGLFGGGDLLGNLSSLAGLFGVPVRLGWSFAGLLNIATKAGNGSLVAHVTPASATSAAGTINYSGASSTAAASATAGAINYSGASSTAAANITAAKDSIYLGLIHGLIAMVISPDLAAPAPSTAISISARQQVANEAAILAHTRQLLIADAVGLSSFVAGAVYDDVIAARREVLAAIDAELLGTHDDALYRALADARAAVYADLTAKARDSARLVMLRPPTILPALALGYDRYEDALRGDEIVARNHVRHPGFVPDRDLLVLSR